MLDLTSINLGLKSGLQQEGAGGSDRRGRGIGDAHRFSDSLSSKWTKVTISNNVHCTNQHEHRDWTTCFATLPISSTHAGPRIFHEFNRINIYLTNELHNVKESSTSSWIWKFRFFLPTRQKRQDLKNSKLLGTSCLKIPCSRASYKNESCRDDSWLKIFSNYLTTHCGIRQQ